MSDLEKIFIMLLCLYKDIELFDETKELVKEYKEKVKELDDDIFLEATEAMREVIDIKEFDRLLALDSFTEEEAEKVEDMIDCSSSIIADKLQDRINELVDLYNKF